MDYMIIIADLLLEVRAWSKEAGHCGYDLEGSISLSGSSLDFLCFLAAMH